MRKEKRRERTTCVERRQQVRQPSLLKTTPLDSDSDGGIPDDLARPMTKTDLSGEVTEAARREVIYPDPFDSPMRPPLP